MCWLECRTQLKPDDARLGKWKWNMRVEWVASSLHTTSERGVYSITTADAHTSAASSRLNWPTPADLKGLVRCAERPNPVSARVPSRFKRAVQVFVIGEEHETSCVWMSECSNTEQSSCLIIIIIFVNLTGCLLRDSTPVYQLHITVIIVSARQVSCSEKRRCAQFDVVIHWCN